MNFVIYFLLTCELSIFQLFSYKDMTTSFGSFLILHARLKKGNNGSYVLRGFFKVTINYLR